MTVFPAPRFADRGTLFNFYAARVHERLVAKRDIDAILLTR